MGWNQAGRSAFHADSRLTHASIIWDMAECKNAESLRSEIRQLVREYYRAQFGKEAAEKAGQEIRQVCYAGRVFDEKEMENLVDSSLDFWLTEGRYSREFEAKFKAYLDVKFALPVNSGSSANLLALTALTSRLLGDRRLRKGNEVITVAAGFPTTVNPIIQNGLIPVFVDVELESYNVMVEQVKQAISSKTRAIMLAHTLGNPFCLEAILKLTKEYDLWVIEDCCDALGSTYRGQMVGTFGHVSTFSFYPAHHITTGEGGMVCTDDPLIARAVRSFRDWGRDCYCEGGQNGRCGCRFTKQYGDLPLGYDHKYVYSHVGYNLKMTDMQAAIGSAQMDKLPAFVKKRKENFARWEQGFKAWERYFILPKAEPESDPSWFAYPVTVRENAGFTRTELTESLSLCGIETRNLFAGNMVKQPAYLQVEKRIVGNLENTDVVMGGTFFLGTYPGLTEAQIAYVLDKVAMFLKEKGC